MSKICKNSGKATSLLHSLTSCLASANGIRMGGIYDSYAVASHCIMLYVHKLK